MQQASRRGFTILELLIVVTIMAILAGLILPVTQSMTIRAYDTKCANNLRQIGMAANAAAADNDNTYPLVEVDNDGKPVASTLSDDGSAPTIAQALAPYGITQNVLICPLDDRDQKFYMTSMAGAQGGVPGSSYMWQPYAEADSSVTPQILRRPGRGGGGPGRTMLTQINVPTSRLQLCSDWIPEHLPSNVPPKPGVRKMSYIVYADGHVRTGINSRNASTPSGPTGK